MKAKILLAALSSLVLSNAGCVSMGKGIANAVQQLKDDQAVVDLDVQTMYGHGHFTRFGPVPGATVTKSSDGNLSVTYPPLPSNANQSSTTSTR